MTDCFIKTRMTYQWAMRIEGDKGWELQPATYASKESAMQAALDSALLFSRDLNIDFELREDGQAIFNWTDCAGVRPQIQAKAEAA